MHSAKSARGAHSLELNVVVHKEAAGPQTGTPNPKSISTDGMLVGETWIFLNT